MSIIRVERCDDVWLVTGLSPAEVEAVKVRDLQELWEPLRSRLAILLTAPVDFYEQSIGRRINENVFWVNTEE